MSWCQYQSSNRVRLYHDQCCLQMVKLNFQWWYLWQNKWFVYQQETQFSCWGMSKSNSIYRNHNILKFYQKLRQCWKYLWKVFNKIDLEKWPYAFTIIHESPSYQVFEPFYWRQDPTNHCPMQNESCLHFQKKTVQRRVTLLMCWGQDQNSSKIRFYL